MKKSFLTGLAILLPVVVTIAIALFLLNLFTRPFMGLVRPFLEALPAPFQTEIVIQRLTQVAILLVLFLIVLLLGIVARWFFFNSLIQFGDRILQHIPLVSKIYKLSREIIRSIMGGEKPSFQQVVLLPFPNSRTFILGLVTKELPGQTDLVSIYLPTTPNPATGYLIVRPKSDLIYLKMRTEEAIKYIISCGVVQPEVR